LDTDKAADVMSLASTPHRVQKWNTKLSLRNRTIYCLLL